MVVFPTFKPAVFEKDLTEKDEPWPAKGIQLLFDVIKR
jgi:hypothetical protein